MATIVYCKILSHQRASGPSGSSRDVNNSLALPPCASTRSQASSPVILACSARSPADFDRTYYLSADRILCEDRKGALDHLYPKKLVLTTIRVAFTQASKAGSQLMADQLHEEMRKDEQVADHLITREQADKETDEWYTRERNKCWNEFFHYRLWQSLAEYHAVTLVIRFYEYVASKWTDAQTLDKLTCDPSKAAKRASEEGIQGRELGRDMFFVCLKANCITFLADYTVQQVLLLAAYYAYVQRQRRRLRDRQRERSDSQGSDNNSEEIAGPLTELILKKSTKIAINQGVCLGFASVGGAIGAMMNPTWTWATTIGTNLGGSLGDQVASTFIDDTTRPAF